MTTTIQFDIQNAEQQLKFQQVLDYVTHIKLPFQTVEEQPEDLKTVTVRTRLTEKYVKTGEWETMDEEEREDAALGEMMIFAQEQPDYKVYSIEESAQILADLKAECYK